LIILYILSMKHNENNKDKVTLHRYGLRMPAAFQKILDEMAWHCRLSYNMKIVDLIIEALHYKLADKYNIDLTKYTWHKHAEADFEDLEKMPKKDREEFLKKLENAIAEYDQWKQTSR
jgi:wobble nucleotide-excising tRNase